MNSMLKYALFGVGGLVLFSGAFVVFAALSGAPLSEVAVIGRFVPKPEGEEEKDAHEAESEIASAPDHAAAPVAHADPAKRMPDKKALEANIGVLGAFLMPSPYSSTELADLQQELRTALADAKERLARIDAREGELDEWERTLSDRLADLKALQASIEKSEGELALREAEVARDEKAKREREAQGWTEVARFFEEGDPEELAQKLVRLGPKEAARILRALDEARAGELVNALPQEKYNEFLEAYRTQSEP